MFNRPTESPDNNEDGYEPSHKISHAGSGENLKFSVEIVQQFEFTASVANSQTQQISTNVTVKAMTNTSIRSDGQPNAGGANTAPQQCNKGIDSIQSVPAAPHHSLDVPDNLVQCKQEADLDLDDLANLYDLINDTPDTLNELISDLQSDYGFDVKPAHEIKTEISSDHRLQQLQFQPTQHHHHQQQVILVEDSVSL